MGQRKIAAWGFLAAGILFLVAAVIPLDRGGSVNVTLVILAGVFIVLGSIVAGMRRNSS